MECSCYLRNVHDKMAEGMTAYLKRYGKEFDVPLILFGALVEYVPITPKDKSRTDQLRKRR